MSVETNYKPFEVVLLRTYCNTSESTDSVDFGVPKRWLEKVLEEDNTTIEKFLNEYTWDNSELIKTRAIAEKVYIGNNDTFPEWCPSCEEEVELENIFDIQECPNCGELILPCNKCSIVPDCANCPLEKSLIIKKLILELEDSAEFIENLCELIGTKIYEDKVMKRQNLILEAKNLLK